MTTGTPAPGEVIGDYEIRERIGGNMGLVFKAHHRLLGKDVALKLVPADWIADPTRLTRFQREMRVMGQLEHPNLVTAADARSVDDWHLVAMELIDGVDLQQLVRTRGPLPVAAACEVARQAAQGLQYAHEHGLIHRDIKPSNLMLTRAGAIKVIDMGLALIREDSTAQLTQTGLVLGTMSYCAPEQFRDASHVDIRADIYSLGCTLYHLLAGKAPYAPRKSFAEIMQAHLHEPFPSLAEALPDAPAGLEAVLTRMTAKDREARFSTPGEVAAALEPFARGTDLGPMVPAKTQQSPQGQPSKRRTPIPPEGTRPTGDGAQQPKPRWTRRDALIGLGGAVTGGAVLLAINRPTKDSNVPGHGPVVAPPNSVFAEPDHVVIMDTVAKNGVYSEKSLRRGRTNAEDLNDVLKDVVPVSHQDNEKISSSWASEQRVIDFRPRLVVIHRSAFFHSYNVDFQFGLPPDFAKRGDDPRFDLLYAICDRQQIALFARIGYRVRDTEFLVYSRGTDPNWLNPAFRDDWVKQIEDDYPWLKGRIHTMVVPTGKDEQGNEKGTLQHPKTAKLFLENVKRLLHK